METVSGSGHGHKPPAADAQQRCREALEDATALCTEARELLAMLEGVVSNLVEATEGLVSPAVIDCPDCQGSGEIRWNPSHSVPPDPQLEQWAECSRCGGYGTIGVQTLGEETAR